MFIVSRGQSRRDSCTSSLLLGVRHTPRNKDNGRNQPQSPHTIVLEKTCCLKKHTCTATPTHTQVNSWSYSGSQKIPLLLRTHNDASETLHTDPACLLSTC